MINNLSLDVSNVAIRARERHNSLLYSAARVNNRNATQDTPEASSRSAVGWVGPSEGLEGRLSLRPLSQILVFSGSLQEMPAHPPLSMTVLPTVRCRAVFIEDKGHTAEGSTLLQSDVIMTNCICCGSVSKYDLIQKISVSIWDPIEQ